jgi:hypothetical protein
MLDVLFKRICDQKSQFQIHGEVGKLLMKLNSNDESLNFEPNPPHFTQDISWKILKSISKSQSVEEFLSSKKDRIPRILLSLQMSISKQKISFEKKLLMTN